MTIQELIEQLTQLAEEYGDEVEVRLATQPSWPFEYSIGNVIAVQSGMTKEEIAIAEAAIRDEKDSTKLVVYIGEGTQLGYLSGNVSRELGWR